jgi:thioredoxin reductase (NADPH)
MDEFTRQYIATALWSSNDESDESGGEPLDKNYSADDLAPSTLEAIERDCAAFQKKNAKLLEKAYGTSLGRRAPVGRKPGVTYDASNAGHDYWLSRNGHGAGFFDRDLGAVGDKLQEAAAAEGESDLYVGDDGLIYASGYEFQTNAPGVSAPGAIAQDFNTPEDAMHHAAHSGYTHFTKIGRKVMVYGPTAEGRTLSARMYRHKGKIHFTEPVISKKAMPKRAKPIEHAHEHGHDGGHHHEHGAPTDHKVVSDGRYRDVGYKVFQDFDNKDGSYSLVIEGGPHNGGEGWHQDGFRTIEEAVAAVHATIDGNPAHYGATDDTATTIPHHHHHAGAPAARTNPEGLTFAEWLAAANFGRRGHFKDDAHMRREWERGVDPTEYAAHQGISREPGEAPPGEAPPKIIEGARETPMAQASVRPPNGSADVHVRRVGGAQAEMAAKDLSLIKVDEPSARRLWAAGVPLTIVGSNVNSFHFFGGWHLAYTVDPSEERYKDQYDVVVNSFNAHLEPELGRRASFFVEQKYMVGSGSVRPGARARAPLAQERGLVWLERPDGVYWANATGGTFWMMPQPSGDYALTWMGTGGDQKDIGTFPYATAVQTAGHYNPVTGQSDKPEYRQGEPLDNTRSRQEHRSVAEAGGRFLTKPGKHGTLHRYRITYKGSENDPSALPMHYNVWAYNEEDARDKFNDNDEGWEVISVARVRAVAEAGGDRHGMTLAEAKAQLAPLGIVLSKKDEEYRVNFRGGGESTAYYTNDIEDAVMTGKQMAKEGRRGSYTHKAAGGQATFRGHPEGESYLRTQREQMNAPSANAGRHLQYQSSHAAEIDPAGEYSQIQRMMTFYAKHKGYGTYVPNTAIPTGMRGTGGGVWSFYTQLDDGSKKRREVDNDDLRDAWRTKGANEPRHQSAHAESGRWIRVHTDSPRDAKMLVGLLQQDRGFTASRLHMESSDVETDATRERILEAIDELGITATFPGMGVEAPRGRPFAQALGEEAEAGRQLPKVEYAMLVGPARDKNTLRLRQFLSRNGHPFQYFDTDEAEGDGIIRQFGLDIDKLPAVIWKGHKYYKPANREIADILGFGTQVEGAHTYDVLVIGAGPAGLSCAVYAASEGLSCLVVEAYAPGGQAANSSRIENYAGFPRGISGADLAAQTYQQAQKFGARFIVPTSAERLIRHGVGDFEIRLSDRSSVHGKSVVLACGAEWRKPNYADLPKFEGAGVYYAATATEGSYVKGQDVVVVGGGNSAGQAAIFMSELAHKVFLIVRGKGLSDTMSDYLIKRITKIKNIELLAHTEIVSLQGVAHLERVTWKTGGVERTEPVRHLFLMIGTIPKTDWLHPDGKNECAPKSGWLGNCVTLDEQGFVKTGADLTAGEWKHPRKPMAFETSMPGAFAVGDVRSGSVKRVATAVGDGAVVITSVHKVLLESANVKAAE